MFDREELLDIKSNTEDMISNIFIINILSFNI